VGVSARKCSGRERALELPRGRAILRRATVRGAGNDGREAVRGPCGDDRLGDAADEDFGFVFRSPRGVFIVPGESRDDDRAAGGVDESDIVADRVEAPSLSAITERDSLESAGTR